jgi:hypothetical protein
MRVSELGTKVSELGTKVSELKTEVDGRFAAVDRELEDLRQQIKSEGEAVRRYVDDRITLEHQATRRHFDVVAEKMMGERNLALDQSMATSQQLLGLTASNAGDHVRFEHRLDDHDRRLERIERRHDTDPA